MKRAQFKVNGGELIQQIKGNEEMNESRLNKDKASRQKKGTIH